jgi:hypothetical protein
MGGTTDIQHAVFSSNLHQALFALVMSLISAFLIPVCAKYYFRRYRIERPAIGTFNGRDIAILFVLLATIPVFYLSLSRVILTTFLCITFLASLSIGFRPVMSPARVWLVIGVLLGLNIWMGNNALGSVLGWQAFWVENDIVILLGAMSVANLYVQGGMKMKHVAWFALLLGGYDVIFTSLFPVTNALVEEFLGFPLDPSFGFRLGVDNAAIGLGDLLVYALFFVTAFKAYGRKAARIAMTVILVFGGILPSMVPLLINYVDARTDTVVPAQFWFGPAAFVTYLIMRRKWGRERTTKEFLASTDVITRTVPTAATPIPAVAEVPEQVVPVESPVEEVQVPLAR